MHIVAAQQRVVNRPGKLGKPVLPLTRSRLRSMPQRRIDEGSDRLGLGSRRGTVSRIRHRPEIQRAESRRHLVDVLLQGVPLVIHGLVELIHLIELPGLDTALVSAEHLRAEVDERQVLKLALSVLLYDAFHVERNSLRQTEEGRHEDAATPARPWGAHSSGMAALYATDAAHHSVCVCFV